MNKRVDELLEAARLNELLSRTKEDKVKKPFVILGVIAAIALIAAAAIFVYNYFKPDYFDDFDDDFDDEDFDVDEVDADEEEDLFDDDDLN